LHGIDINNKCFALTRYDLQEDGNYKFHERKDSQDTWIFKGHINKNINGNFCLGTRGCDNKIAYEIAKAGYEITNPCLTIKSYHLHFSQLRNHREGEVTNKPPYKTLPFIMIKKDELKRKILHIALNVKEQQCLCQALSNLGEYYRLDWQDIKNRNGVGNLHKQILNCVDIHKIDLIFMQIQTPDIIDSNLINKILAINPDINIVNWNGDARDDVHKWYIDVGRCKNVFTMFTNMNDIGTLKSNGINAYYLNIGYENHIFKPEGLTNKIYPDIVFMGNNYRDRFPLSKLRIDMHNLLKKQFGNKYKTYGNGWLTEKSLMNNQQEEAIAYRSCKIAIGLSHYDYRRYSSDRIFRAMGTGAFYLVKKYPEIEFDFEDKKHLVCWNTLDELVELTNYYLQHEDERKEIAKQGQLLVSQNHTWEKRIHEMLNIIGW
jgi:spore maturation protein CgeB